MMRGLFTVLALTPSLGKIIWQSDIQEHQRRLALNLVKSINDTADPNCIIGGYDDENAARILVGGPCSKFNYNASTPLPGFRWVAMETLDLDLVGPPGVQHGLTSNNPVGWPILQAKDVASHAEVGLCGMFKFDDPTVSEAGFFASTTSYLAKQSMTINENTFVVGKTDTGAYETIDLCIQNCCATVPAEGCKCSVCPKANISVVPGDFKYSIVAAAFDSVPTATKGWTQFLDKHGETVAGVGGTTKELKGHMSVYQAIDFSNMSADTITVTGTDDSEATYASMQACSLSSLANCTAKSVKSMTIAADGWEGVTYTFPQYFNRGQWAKRSNGAYGATTIDTKPVVIEIVRLDDASLKAVNMRGNKVFFVRYKFDITGIDANDKTGKYFVYDPTVNTVTGAKVKSSGSGEFTQTGQIAKGARTSTGLTLLAALMVVLNVLK